MEGDSKHYARVKVIDTVIAEVERGMRERGFPVPPPAAWPTVGCGLALALQHREVEDFDAGDAS